jgi:TRAP-type mannitol/chloroaromatic compound transport system permease large subunit
MSDLSVTLGLLALLILLLGSGVWVAFALAITGMAGMLLLSNAPIGPILATTFWGHSHSWALAALPMFILMGEILLRSRLSEDMFSGLAPWLGRLPGKLLHVNVFGGNFDTVRR